MSRRRACDAGARVGRRRRVVGILSASRLDHYSLEVAASTRTLGTVAVTLGLVLVLAVADKALLHVYVPEEQGDDAIAMAVAQQLLGDWDRSVAQSVRSADNHVALRESVL